MASIEPFPPSADRVWWSWKPWAALIAFTVTFTVLIATQNYLMSSLTGRPGVLGLDRFWVNLPQYLVNVIYVPTVWFVAHRIKFEKLGWAGSVCLHVVAAIILAYGRISAIVLIQFVEMRWLGLKFLNENMSLVDMYRSGLFTTYLIWYCAVVGLYFSFEFHRQSEERLKTAAELRESLVQAKLQTIRSHFNPHFLFNTLNTVSVFAQKGEREAVVEMIERLSNLLRIVLDESRPERISFQKELEFIDGYLDIQRIRFGDRLTIDYEVDGDALQAQVPAMILQPIVENAVMHGASTTGGTSLTIEASRQNGLLRVRVGDSGAGFGNDHPPVLKKGTGLTTTETRLKYMYGESYRIEYSVGGSCGSTVTMLIPFQAGGGLVSSVEAPR